MQDRQKPWEHCVRTGSTTVERQIPQRTLVPMLDRSWVSKTSHKPRVDMDGVGVGVVSVSVAVAEAVGFVSWNALVASVSASGSVSVMAVVLAGSVSCRLFSACAALLVSSVSGNNWWNETESSVVLAVMSTVEAVEGVGTEAWDKRPKVLGVVGYG